MFYSGVPIAEQSRYVGAQYLPALAGLKNRYLQQKFNLQGALAQLTEKQRTQAMGIRQDELDREERQRQFDAQLAAQREQNAIAARGSSGGGSGISLQRSTTPTQTPQVLGTQKTLRQQWQDEANAGDWNAQVALNYAGDDGRYDGPVNSQAEFNVLRSMGIQGGYYVRGSGAQGGGGGGW